MLATPAYLRALATAYLERAHEIDASDGAVNHALKILREATPADATQGDWDSAFDEGEPTGT